MPPDMPASPCDTTADQPLAASLRAEALRLGFSRVGIAAAVPPPHHAGFRHWLDGGLAGAMHAWLARHEPVRQDPVHLLAGAKSVVVLATDYCIEPTPTHDIDAAGSRDAWGPLPAGQGSGRVARYAWGDDYHDLLRSRANTLAAWLESQAPGCRTRGVVDSAPLAERDYGLLAGLGWIGKNTMLIDPRAGSYFFLTAILTDLDLPTDTPLEVDHCGTCTACLDACPTDAFVAPRVLDARRCISGLTIEDHGDLPADLRPLLGDWVFGCDVCQEVCPWNRHAPGSTEPSFQPRAAGPTLPLVDLLGLDEASFRDRFRGSPLLRAKRRGLLRSAAIALGNTPAPEAFAALAAALGDDEPVLRTAAAWALGRWRRAGIRAAEATAVLEARLAAETDASVRLELDAALGS
jgi:epoxyqueuosine reductase